MTRTRREFVKATGAALLGTAAASGVASGAAGEAEHGWTVVESPTEKTLYGVVDTAAGPFAVGAGGDVLARRREGWERVVNYGPQARSRPLHGVDVTDDGTRIWFDGGSGVIGEYDVTTDTLTNYSAPMGKTSTWEDVAVAGIAGESERVYFVNGSGEELSGERTDSGAIAYEPVTKPGGGSTIPGIDFRSRTAGHACDTSQGVYGTTGGESYDRVGIRNASVGFHDVASVADDDVNVAGGSGLIYRYDGVRWTPHVVSDDRLTVRALDRTGELGIAAGDGGYVYDRESAGRWTPVSTPTTAKLRGVSRGASGLDVAVGGGGRILERRRTDDYMADLRPAGTDVTLVDGETRL